MNRALTTIALVCCSLTAPRLADAAPGTMKKTTTSKSGKAKPATVTVGALKVSGPKVTKRNGVAVIHPPPKGVKAQPVGEFQIHEVKAPPKPAMHTKRKKAYGLKTLKPVSKLSAVRPIDGAAFLSLHRASFSAGSVEGRPSSILLTRGSIMGMAMPIRATGGDDLLVQCSGRFASSMKMSTTLLRGSQWSTQSSATFQNVTDSLQFVVAGNPSTVGTLRIAFAAASNESVVVDSCSITRL